MSKSFSNTPVRILQLSDCHLGASQGDVLLGLDTDQSLQDVLDHIVGKEDIYQWVIATGDISGDNAGSAYERFLSCVETQLQRPVAWLAGNHDEDATMRRFPSQRVKRERVELEHWQLILLDSAIPGHGYGQFSSSELERLRRQLEQCDKHTIVFTHHQPLPMGSEWLDRYVIRNGAEFLELLQRYPQVKAVCWGHVHQDSADVLGNLWLYSVPSTCIQFKPECDEFTVDTVMPGYRWLDLYPNGEIKTAVERIPHKVYPIDYESNGY